MPDARHPNASPPPVSAWLQNGFHAFLKPYLRRHFHCVGLHREGFDPRSIDDGQPVIVYGNHPSWWDPLIAHFLNSSLFRDRQFHAPIDAAALRQYRVFEKLGFYGVDLRSTTGSATFLRTSMAILNAGDTTLWITPEGRFCDARDHATPLMPGLAHLCTKLDRGWIVPLALEYPFWDERLPLCVARFGTPLDVRNGTDWDKPRWNDILTEHFRVNQRRLADGVIAREPSQIDPLMIGSVGAGAFYDTMRRFRSWITRSSFRASHGEHFQ